MISKSRTLSLGFTLIVLLTLATVASASDCPEPAPDPVGWWEWYGTYYYQSGWFYPGDWGTVPLQRHYTEDGIIEYYQQEELTGITPVYEVVCCHVGWWAWCIYEPAADWYEHFEIHQYPSGRRLSIIDSDIEGWISYWDEREPIGSVRAVASSLSAVKSLYR